MADPPVAPGSTMAEDSPDPWEPLRGHFIGTVSQRLSRRGWKGEPSEIRSQIATPSESKGDLALPIFRWAKSLGMPPGALAKELAEDFPTGPGLAEVTTENGFINVTASVEWLAQRTLGLILSRGNEYGHHPPREEAVCVEHTSANPTGPLHVGRSRNSILGDTLVRVLRARGHPVTVHFYVDDIGRQAATLVWLWRRPPSEWPPEIRARSGVPADGRRPPDLKPDAWRGLPYAAASEYLKSHPEAAEEVARLARLLEEGKLPVEEYRAVPREIMEGVCETLRRVHVSFDEFAWESDFELDGSVRDVLRRLRASPRARIVEGALGIDAHDLGLPKEDAMVFVTRGDGADLYPARDVAYHLSKFRRFARVIDVLGEDHKLHYRGLLALLEAMGEPRRPEAIFYSFVNLPEGRMTTRGGRVVLLDDVLDRACALAREEVRKRRENLSPEEIQDIAEKVGCAAVRFHLLRVQAEKPITFRWEEALSFEGKSAPFLQYAHARACSLLEKARTEAPELLAGRERVARGEPVPFPPGGPEPSEKALLRALSRLPSLVDQVAMSASVHLLALYGHEVAERFNEFYQSLRVLNADPPQRPFRLLLVEASRQVLRNTLDLIGVEAVEAM